MGVIDSGATCHKTHEIVGVRLMAMNSRFSWKFAHQGLGVICLALTLSSSPLSAQIAISGQLRLANQAYLQAGANERAGASQALRQALAKDQLASADERAKAYFLLGDQDVTDRKNDRALRQVKTGLALLEGRLDPQAARVRALGHQVRMQALMAKGERELAYKQALDARQDYGPPKPMADETWDRTWDQLFMWRTITYASLRGAEKSRADAMSGHFAETQNRGGTAGQCPYQDTPIKIDNWEANLPDYPIMAIFSNRSGGVMMRVDVGPDGRASKIVSTAYTPSVDFAIMTERAARGMTFSGSGLSDPACRTGRPVLVLFRAG